MRSLQLLIAFALTTLVLNTTATAITTAPVKVFIFAGQSNMVGADAHAKRIDQFPMFQGAGAVQEDVLFATLATTNSTTHAATHGNAPASWGPLAPSDSFGPEITFARMVKKHDDAPIAIIKSAIGGTNLAFDWNPSAPEQGQKLYPRTLKLIQDSLQELDRRGVRYQLEAVIWHQGENDMLDRKLNAHYAERLTQLIAQLRTDLHAPSLPWFIGEVSEKGIWGMDNRSNLAILRQQQDQVIKADPLLHWVPTSHLAFEVMDSGQPHYHFATQGQLQMGEAFAAAYLDAIAKPLAVKDRSYKNGLPFAKKARVRLFVLAGQRNMEGEDSFAAQIPQMPGFESLVNDQNDVIYRYCLGGGVQTSRQWEPLGIVDNLGTFGPELSFGATLRRSIDANDGIAIVKFTHSGAQSPDWSPTGSPETRRNLYPKFTAFIRAAIEDLKAQGYDCTLEGVFWHVGENDSYFDPYLRSYAASMQKLIAQVRLDFHQPALAWFISEQHPRALGKNLEAINSAIHTMAESDKAIVVVQTSHLPHQRVHFATKGTLLLGEEMAKAFLKAK